MARVSRKSTRGAASHASEAVTLVGEGTASHSTDWSAGTPESEGARVSRTVRTWLRDVELPQASVAVQVREITLALLELPQLLLVESLKRIVTEPQPSVAVATPKAFVVVSAGHCNVTLVGQVMIGGVVSRTVMVCVQLALLLQTSVAVQRRAMMEVWPQPGVMVSA